MASLLDSQDSFSIVEADISTLRRALDLGWISSVDLVSRYLRRIAIYDRRGQLNSIPIINPSVFDEAAASDERRANGGTIRPLEGIPFTVKDSYKVKGMTVASGSPAFQNLIANEDAFTIKALKDAGAVLIGRTNMPPMAAGGMQRGVYGRAESPYNPEYLTAAFGSGSSNGSATSTASSFAAFGMGEETVSSGRSPASNNGLVAYTPSRGMISIRGNWPLYPTCDVVVPHTRTMSDMLEVADIIVAKDDITTGDFWRDQKYVSLPDVNSVKPTSFKDVAKCRTLEGKRFGIPKMYLNGFTAASRPIITRPSILALWADAKQTLSALGATVIEVDLPIMQKYDTVSAWSPTADTAGLDTHPDTDTDVETRITDAWVAIEKCDLIALAWDDFLRQNSDPAIPSLAAVKWDTIFPPPVGALPDQYTQRGPAIAYDRIIACLEGRGAIGDLPGIEAALKALERRRERDFENWLDAEGLDAIVFPANADVGRANADVDKGAADDAWRNGVMFSNGNRVLRHLGIPTLTVTMGVMQDTHMPVGLTFAGKAYDDGRLMGFATVFEGLCQARCAPVQTPGLESDVISKPAKVIANGGGAGPVIEVIECKKMLEGGKVLLSIRGTIQGNDDVDLLTVTIDGHDIDGVVIGNGGWQVKATIENIEIDNAQAEINKTLVVVMARNRSGCSTARLLFLN